MYKMKKYIYTTIAVLIAALVLSTVYFYNRTQYLKTERDVYKGNSETLLDDVKTYKTKDSLNAATIGDLVLRKSEFEKHRKEDADLIKTLETKNRQLQSVATAQTQTINYLKGNLRDSIVFVPIDPVTPGNPGQILYKTDTLRCVDIVEPWFELHGCSNKDGQFTGSHINRDSLLIAVTVKYKRFLGFLWRTNKIKDRKVDVVSKNPATEIKGVEYIEIRN